MGKVLKVEPNFPLYTGSSTPRIAQSPCNISKSIIHATGKVFSLFSKLWQMEKIITLLNLISCITSYSGVIRIGISSKRIQKTPKIWTTRTWVTINTWNFPKDITRVVILYFTLSSSSFSDLWRLTYSIIGESYL